MYDSRRISPGRPLPATRAASQTTKTASLLSWIQAGISSGLLLVTAAFAAPPVITSPATASGNVGVPFSYRITATNSPTRFDYELAVPSLGIAFFTGIISGTPSSEGTYVGTIKATNADGTGTAPLTITIGPPLATAPVITSPPYALAVIGRAFSYPITATNNPTGFSSGFFDEGLALDPTSGVLSGIAGGTPRWVASTIRATNTAGTGIGDLLIAFAPETAAAPEIFYPAELSFVAGEPLSFWIGATNAPVLFDATPLPAGLGIAHNLGLVQGTPATPGSYTVVLRAINAAGTGTASLTLHILAAGSYAAWLHELGLSGSGTAPDVDLDRDGAGNLLEFAFRTDPLSSTSVHRPEVVISGASLALTHRRHKDTELTWTYETSADLAVWTMVTPTLAIVDADADHDGKVELVRALLPVSAGEGRKFLRVRVSLP